MPSQKVILPADNPDPTIEGATRRLHHRERTVTIAAAPTVVQEQNVIPRGVPHVYATWAASTFRTAGIAGVWQPILVLENNYHLHVDYLTTLPMLLHVRRLNGILELGTAVAALANRPRFVAFRSTESAVGGTEMTPYRFDTSGPIVSGSPHRLVAAVSDDAVPTAITGITAPAAGVTPAWTDPHDSLMGANAALSAGQWVCHPESLLPRLINASDDPLYLRPAERLVVAVVGAGYAEYNYTLNLVFNEGYIP